MAENETDIWDVTYPDDYIPVRGDTIRYYDLNWRAGVVLNSQDGEVTFLTPENRSRTFNANSIKVALDRRMRLLTLLDEEDALKNREEFLNEFMDNAKKREEKEAISKGAIIDDDGTILTAKKRGKQIDIDRAKEIKTLVNGVISFIKNSNSPVYKKDITSNFDMDANTYNMVMKKVMADHTINKSGQKRGTNYRIVGRTYDS